jgi:hypothetical protein
MNCCDPNTKNVQLLEPDNLILSTTSSGSMDASLQESGSEILAQGASVLLVYFKVTKASPNYRFEYLYVDAFGKIVNPGIINPVVVLTNELGFMVEFAGATPEAGYVLRWRVVVIDTLIGTAFEDFPERLRVQIPANVSFLVVTFENPRSTVNYGFSELRVENLTDPVATQRIILAQVAVKTTINFTVGLNPRTNNANYYLVCRTP